MKIEIKKERYFKLLIDDQLNSWETRTNPKTIALINGARRTRKTHALAFLGENEFKNYEIIEVDKMNDEDVKNQVE